MRDRPSPRPPPSYGKVSDKKPPTTSAPATPTTPCVLPSAAVNIPDAVVDTENTPTPITTNSAAESTTPTSTHNEPVKGPVVNSNSTDQSTPQQSDAPPLSPKVSVAESTDTPIDKSAEIPVFNVNEDAPPMRAWADEVDDDDDDWEDVDDDDGDEWENCDVQELRSAHEHQTASSSGGNDWDSEPASINKRLQKIALTKSCDEHILELSEFPESFRSHHIMEIFQEYKHHDPQLRWIHDTCCLIIFQSAAVVRHALNNISHPFMTIKPYSQSCKDARAIEDELPAAPRPPSDTTVAKRFINSALRPNQIADKKAAQAAEEAARKAAEEEERLAARRRARMEQTANAAAKCLSSALVAAAASSKSPEPTVVRRGRGFQSQFQERSGGRLRSGD